MPVLRRKHLIWGVGFLIGIVLGGPINVYGEDSAGNNRVPEGVYIKMTKDFYEALKGENSAKVKIYSNDPSDEYLRKIAIATRTMVETNLQILKQQEIMIELLRSFLKSKSK